MAPILTPTQITDKNGKSTTVHKRLDTPQSASKMSKVPAPSIAPKVAASVASHTPLPTPEPLSETEHSAFLEWQHSELDTMRYRIEIKNTFKQRFDPAAEALVWRIVQSGKVPNETIGRFLGTFHTRRTRVFAKNFGYAQEEVLSQLTSSLLLAERLGTEYPESVMEGTPLNFASVVEKALVGYAYTGKKTDRVEATTIDTEEVLTSVAAVTAYMVAARTRQDLNHYKDSTFVSVNDKKVQGMYIANRSLDTFLRENPHEVHRAIAYAEERGMGNTAKDTKQLIQHLHDTEGMGALTEGWL